MHRPGGYLVGHGDLGIVDERDTFSCNHCNRVVFAKGAERAADIGGLCKMCMGLICPACVGEVCVTLEKRLAAQEASYHARRSYEG